MLEAVGQGLPELLTEVVLEDTGSIGLAAGGIKSACPECGERLGPQGWRGRGS